MKYYIVDAFTDELFKGNQAGVCLLEKWLDDSVLQNIAAENNLAETAFIVKNNNEYDLRWFTPEVEIDLCGHATLASAFVISNFVNQKVDIINFHTKSGLLSVIRTGDLFEMDFPSRKSEQIEISSIMSKSIGTKVLEAHLSRDLLLLVDTEEQVKKISPNLELIKTIPNCFAVIVTAKGKKVDFVSRFFAPNAGIPEDSVTGSSHSTLIPFWSKKLNKDDLIAFQLSKRGGKLYCKNCGDRVKISGYATLYLTGDIHVF
ncbi:PhzF family phenazine biosynthesis protein [[Clostridium] fimetarium]|uniref:Phenazine biosynthesis protein PhzF family n=1 Tax=[Clostridium] fimetarium TaxID=99656 RepID=A0A1I0RS48_9FIRM|nr:PhzF family phenazine biosynthesis protein [[Clostridium] fimetarium]SEW44110.1 phenazine biosynthesis protein PhzF family [[Clostridium] fimetarium]